MNKTNSIYYPFKTCPRRYYFRKESKLSTVIILWYLNKY